MFNVFPEQFKQLLIGYKKYIASGIILQLFKYLWSLTTIRPKVFEQPEIYCIQ